MSLLPRHQALLSILSESASRPGLRDAERRPVPHVGEIFGANVFNDAVQRQRLPKQVYQALRRTLEGGVELDPTVGDAVANAMKDWAIEHGATHYTHWFQPMTGLAAEKHDAFLTPTLEGGAIQEFSGKELILGEPDASSLPSGGLRNTFEARGYTGWDPTSPAFLRVTKYGSTLTIPTVFASWTGEALDTKTPLLRSCEAIDREARRLLELLGHKDVRQVTATIGPEQEYFLVDRKLHALRPDLVSCGRTLLGAKPSKGQELEDHYFSLTPGRILDFMMDLEHELWTLGVPAKTRHGEVAPHQFELAPVFESASVAADHNVLTMETIGSVADRHGLVALMHEKPFAGINGSGKHVNWAIATDDGDNLLSPGSTALENQRFLAILAGVVRAVDLHQDLLRASIAHAGNDHRLGANEAPPAILSVYLGDELQHVVETLIGSASSEAPRTEDLRLGVTALPPLPIHTSDRNRTSPFAFTGNKFEFRAVGSSQSVAFPAMVINTIVADALKHISERIEAAGNRDGAIEEVVRETFKEHQRILFSGDNYSDEWRAEAERRGLLNLPDTPSGLERFDSAENRGLFERQGVLSAREVESRSHVMHMTYAHRLAVEGATLTGLARTLVLPAALAFQNNLAEGLASTTAVNASLDLSSQQALLQEVVGAATRLQASIDQLDQALDQFESFGEDAKSAARHGRDAVVPVMDQLRQISDRLEILVPDNLWPLPKYRELLFVH